MRLAAPAVAALFLVAATLRAPLHGDFDHYTFALTWQPGICATGGGCLSDQPKSPLIGLHGLWASRPRALIERGVTDPQWWKKGCDYYVHSIASPPIAASLRASLGKVMPHFEHSLLVHEYDKHVQCFGFDPTTFFSTELRMRTSVAGSTFGKYLVSHAGRITTHEAITAQFVSTFSTSASASLQLQCEKNDAGQVVLTQFWITIKTAELADFPRSASFMNSPANQDTCPAEFLIPAWPR